MTHPTIYHIDDVLPHIAGRDEFVVAQRDGYQVIDYNFALADSFDDPVRVECRGIKFSQDGRIIARPLHKFFNIGERPDTQPNLLDFSQSHAVTEKLDGSMIHPAIVNGEVVFMTRMGRTDVARKAERHLTPAMSSECRIELEAGVTPIFEFTAPDNQIVIRYGESALSILAMRWTRSGEYLDRTYCAEVAAAMGAPLVAHHSSDWSSGQAFADYAHAVTGIEGFVVRFDSGLWVKAKGTDYILKHRAKDSVLQEKNVLALVVGGGLDDVLPLLDAADRARIEVYRDGVLSGLTKTAHDLTRFVAANDSLSQKEFAVSAVPTLPQHLRSLAFQVRTRGAASAAVNGAVLKSVGSATAVEAVRPLHGALWA